MYKEDRTTGIWINHSWLRQQDALMESNQSNKLLPKETNLTIAKSWHNLDPLNDNKKCLKEMALSGERKKEHYEAQNYLSISTSTFCETFSGATHTALSTTLTSCMNCTSEVRIKGLTIVVKVNFRKQLCC